MLMLLLGFFSSSFALTKHRYEVRSAIIHYKSKGSGSTFGIKSDINGESTFYMNNWGESEVRKAPMK